MNDQNFSPESSIDHIGETLRRGFEVMQAVAKRHEDELRKLIDAKGGGTIVDILTDGSITAEQLHTEFVDEATQAGIDLETYFREAPRSAGPHGHRFELTTFMQIVFYHLQQEQETRKAE